MQTFKNTIKKYLDNRAKTDELFAQSYANPKKTINDCVAFIMGEARKQGGNAVCVPDEVVYGWAVHYYDEADIKVENLPRGIKDSVIQATVPTLTEADKKKLLEQAEAEYKQQCIDKMRAADEAKAKKEGEKKRAQAQRKKDNDKNQTDLFQFLGL